MSMTKTQTYVVTRILTKSHNKAIEVSGLQNANQAQQQRYRRAQKMMFYNEQTLQDCLLRYIAKHERLASELKELKMHISATEDAILAKKQGDCVDGS